MRHRNFLSTITGCFLALFAFIAIAMYGNSSSASPTQIDKATTEITAPVWNTTATPVTLKTDVAALAVPEKFAETANKKSETLINPVTPTGDAFNEAAIATAAAPEQFWTTTSYLKDGTRHENMTASGHSTVWTKAAPDIVAGSGILISSGWNSPALEPAANISPHVPIITTSPTSTSKVAPDFIATKSNGTRQMTAKSLGMSMRL